MVEFSKSEAKIKQRRYFRDIVVKDKDVVLMTDFPDYYMSEETQAYIGEFKNLPKVIICQKDRGGKFNLPNYELCGSVFHSPSEIPDSAWIDLNGSISERNVSTIVWYFEKGVREILITSALSRRGSRYDWYPFATTSSCHNLSLNYPNFHSHCQDISEEQLEGLRNVNNYLFEGLLCAKCRMKRYAKQHGNFELIKYWENPAAGTCRIWYANFHLKKIQCQVQ